MDEVKIMSGPEIVNWLSLSPEILINIVQLLDPKFIDCISQVSSLLLDICEYVWKDKLKLKFNIIDSDLDLIKQKAPIVVNGRRDIYYQLTHHRSYENFLSELSKYDAIYCAERNYITNLYEEKILNYILKAYKMATVNKISFSEIWNYFYWTVTYDKKQRKHIFLSFQHCWCFFSDKDMNESYLENSNLDQIKSNRIHTEIKVMTITDNYWIVNERPRELNHGNLGKWTVKAKTKTQAIAICAKLSGFSIKYLKAKKIDIYFSDSEEIIQN
jgi:hypothetical protein